MAPTPANLSTLPTGYYRVRKNSRWIVAHWKPAAGHWNALHNIFTPLYFDEIGEKVA